MTKLIHFLTITIFSFGVFSLSSCGAQGTERSVKINTAEEIKKEKKQTPDIADVSFKDGMTGKVFHNYLQVKMALINSDLPGVQTAAANLAEAFTEERNGLKELAQQIAIVEDIEIQRSLFSQFSGKVEPLFKQNLSEGTIYKQHCPMAFDNKGADWFSDVEGIKNPYFGDKMLTCGKVAEVIN